MDIEKISQSGAFMTRMLNTEKSESRVIPEKLIQDEDILMLRNRLKQTDSVEDLFK